MGSRHHQQSVQTAIIAVIVVAAALFAIGSALQHTVSCFLLSFILAYLFDPLLVAMERKRVRRIYGLAVLYAGITVAAFFFFTFLVPFLTTRWFALVQEMPNYLQKAKDLVLSLKVRMLPSSATNEWLWLIQTVTGQIDTFMGGVGAKVYAAATGLVFNLFNLVLAPILVFFMLFYKQDVKAFVTNWLPLQYRESILKFGCEINESVGGYLRGQIIVSAIVAVLVTVTLVILDVDYPVFNGIFAGVSSILPFIGVILATLPPLFFAYVKFQQGIVLLKILVAFSVIYFLEGYLIKPLVFRKSMDINPLATIIVVMAFGELMGFWGIVLAIPIAAAFKIFTDHLRRGDFTR